jgi:tRNA A-37 threonylcarbamoyl transferase component Bud32
VGSGGRGRPPRLRLRADASSLVALPWSRPLASWSPAESPLLDVPLGDSRHIVRVVQAGDRSWALKELPRWVAEREHAALVALQRRGVPAVRPAGLVTREADGDAVLVTEFLDGSVLWRSLLMPPPDSAGVHRARLHEAVAVFLVDLHRRGVFWGDCSLSNLLFRRDGRALQPCLVDAETAEVRPSLTDGQRRHDLEILTTNLAGGLLDVAAELQQTVDVDAVVTETHAVAVRYTALWQALHAQPCFPFARRQDAVAEVSRLHDLGYAVEEVRLTSEGAGRDEVRLQTVVAQRRHRADELRRLTGLEVGEGQAAVLLSDLRSHGRVLPGVAEPDVARSWVAHVLRPAVDRLRAALPGPMDAVQDYCDLLEVRWLLSEQAGRDVGDDAAVQALAAGGVPGGSAAELGSVRI